MIKSAVDSILFSYFSYILIYFAKCYWAITGAFFWTKNTPAFLEVTLCRQAYSSETLVPFQQSDWETALPFSQGISTAPCIINFSRKVWVIIHPNLSPNQCVSKHLRLIFKLMFSNNPQSLHDTQWVHGDIFLQSIKCLELVLWQCAFLKQKRTWHQLKQKYIIVTRVSVSSFLISLFVLLQLSISLSPSPCHGFLQNKKHIKKILSCTFLIFGSYLIDQASVGQNVTVLTYFLHGGKKRKM